MKFTHVQITKHSLEVRNTEEPSTQVGDEWDHRTRPAEVADIVALLRGDAAARAAVLRGLEGTDPRLPDLSANRAAAEAMLRQEETYVGDLPPDTNFGSHRPGRA